MLFVGFIIILILLIMYGLYIKPLFLIFFLFQVTSHSDSTVGRPPVVTTKVVNAVEEPPKKKVKQNMTKADCLERRSRRIMIISGAAPNPQQNNAKPVYTTSVQINRSGPRITRSTCISKTPLKNNI